MISIDIFIYIILLLVALWSYYSGKLTRYGAVAADLVGLLVYKGAGLTGLTLLAAFFIVSTIATKWQAYKKEV